jgi:serpin B
MAQEAESQRAGQAGASLGAELYQSLAAKAGNILLSPYSISEAIALLSAGAEGRTKQELLQSLGWGEPSDRMAEAFASQDRQLQAATRGSETLLTVSGLWFQRDNAPLSAFLKTAQGDYGAEVRGVDFLNDAMAARSEINGWVELKTFGNIRDLIPPGLLNENSRLMLVNAIYFKGRWEHPFETGITEPRPFFVASDKKVQAPAMIQVEHFKFVSESECGILELPYQGGKLSMVILLPKAVDGLPSLEKRMSSPTLQAWLAALDSSKRRNIRVTLPRFKMAYATNLTAALEHAGVESAFSRNDADFSALDGKYDLYVSTALHAAFVDVNEEGTVAAAATGVGVVTFDIELWDEFRVDHPFIFLIRDEATGCLLFLGRIEDPRTP